MAKVTIGGTVYTVPELNFVALELAWPHIERGNRALNPIDGSGAGISVIAAGISEDPDFDGSKFDLPADMKLTDYERHVWVDNYLKKKLKATELDGVRQALLDICEEAGLEVAGEGEDQEDQLTLNLSAETAPPSSPNSSQPDARAAAGTA